ncbi:hypothetical protein [Planctomycetes bacterium Pan216]
MKQTKWALVGALLSGVLIGSVGWWIAQPGDAYAQASSVLPAEQKGIVALLSPNQSGSQLLYLIDQPRQSLCVYSFDSKTKKLKLAAVRHFGADQQLAEFNNEPPTVAEIERLVRPR